MLGLAYLPVWDVRQRDTEFFWTVQKNPSLTPMPRPKSTPTYCVHKRTGRAFVTVDGRQVPLGLANTPESLAAYDRTIAAWLANGRKLPEEQPPGANRLPTGPTVSVLIEAFWAHATRYYVTPARDAAGNPITNEDGTPQTEPSQEQESYRQALIPLRWLYGGSVKMETARFGCPELEALREAMIRPGEWRTAAGKVIQHGAWCRTYTNRQIGRVKHVFAWGVTKKLVPAAVHAELQLLPGLRRGKSAAPEPRPVKAVPLARALAIVPHVSRQVGVMIQVQLVTGMRSTELCIMRPCDIDRSAKPWVYRPMFHKTQDHDVEREIPLGPKVRKLIAPFLKRDPKAFLFSPAEADARRKADARKARETHVQPSQVLRAKNAAKRKHGRAPRSRYDRGSYYRAVLHGCEKAFNMPADFQWDRKDAPALRTEKARKRAAWQREHAWHPHQARHRGATDARKGGGLEVAQILLGHSNTKMTQRYAEADVEKTHELMERVG
ncbi:MAG: site-specific tyrosine recombinase XerC [Pseudonocardiales bacterium]|nr:site-specific tyrosine recombinase XerC [Pseudonocardiales bacterium]